MMKKLLLIITAVIMTANVMAEDSIVNTTEEKPMSIVHQYADENYKLYPTQNMYVFILLDTRNGRLELIQWNTKSSSRTRALLSWQRCIGYNEEIPGRFALYPTTNIYNFIMVDQVDGRTWQVQWAIDEKDRWVDPIH